MAGCQPPGSHSKQASYVLPEKHFYRGRTVHRDFALVEYDSGPEQAPWLTMRNVFRSAWAVPTDTYITGELPDLLTKLSFLPDGPNHRR